MSLDVVPASPSLAAILGALGIGVAACTAFSGAEVGPAAGSPGGSAGTSGAAGSTAGGAAGAGAAGAGGNGTGGASAGGGGISAGTSGAAGASGGTGGKGGVAGSGGSSGAGGTGGTAGKGGVEVCTNGADDDGDGLIDCADSDCSSAACVPQSPAGFSGPVALYLGSAPPPCDGDLTILHQGPITAPPATCNSCSCAAPAGGTCGKATFTTYAGTGCTGASAETTEAPGACTGLTSPVGNDYFIGHAVGASGGVCVPAGGGVTTPPPVAKWASDAALCARASGGGCPSGKGCVAKAPPGYSASTCVRAPGDVACPAEWANRTVLHEKLTDERTCAPCACGDAIGAACPAHTTLFDLTGCSTQLAPSLAHDEKCVSAGGTESFRLDLGAPAGGTCAASGGQPSGAATAASPVTVCCM